MVFPSTGTSSSSFAGVSFSPVVSSVSAASSGERGASVFSSVTFSVGASVTGDEVWGASEGMGVGPSVGFSVGSSVGLAVGRGVEGVDVGAMVSVGRREGGKVGAPDSLGMDEGPEEVVGDELWLGLRVGREVVVGALDALGTVDGYWEGGKDGIVEG